MQLGLTVGKNNSRKTAKKKRGGGGRSYITLHILARISFYSKIDLECLGINVYIKWQ